MGERPGARTILWLGFAFSAAVSMACIGVENPPVVEDAAAGGAADGGIADVPVGDVPPARVELRIAWWGGADRFTRTGQAIELFQKKHPHIRFVFGPPTPNASEYWTAMDEAALAGTLPDVMQHDHKYIAAWASKGHLTPLDDLVKDGDLRLGDVAPALVDGGRIGGKLVGVSLGSNTQCFVVDTAALARAEIPVPPATWTWDDFEQIATTLKARAAPPLVWAHGKSLTTDAIWKGVYLSAGTWVFNVANDGLAYTDDAPLVEHLARALRLQQAGAILPRAVEKMRFTMTDPSTYPIVTGESAMEFLSGSNLIVAMSRAAGPTRMLKLMPIPRRKGGLSAIYIKPSQFFAIPSTSRHKKEAALFIDFFTNDVAANEILKGERGVPVASAVLAAVKAKLNPATEKAEIEHFEFIARMAGDARPLPAADPLNYGDLTRLYEKTVSDAVLLDGTVTPEAAAPAFRTQANTLLAPK